MARARSPAPKKTVPAAPVRRLEPGAEAKRALISRLKRIEGQLRGIQAMIEREEGCELVLQQMAASRRALERAFYATVACAYEMEASIEQADERVVEKLQSVSELLVKYG